MYDGIIMNKVKSLKAAYNWFNNRDRKEKQFSNKTLICVNYECERKVNSYLEAKDFYQLTKSQLLIEKLHSYEKTIDSLKQNLIRHKNIRQTVIDEIDPEGTILKATNIFKQHIVECEEVIKEIIKNNPELEPYWILHQITK